MSLLDKKIMNAGPNASHYNLHGICKVLRSTSEKWTKHLTVSMFLLKNSSSLLKQANNRCNCAVAKSHIATMTLSWLLLTQHFISFFFFPKG